MSRLDVVIVGGGMITQMQIMPSLLYLKRTGRIGEITVSALNGRPLKALAEDPLFTEAFPGDTFRAMPDFRKVDLDETFPELFKEAIASLEPYNLVVVAVPDQLHYGVLKAAMERNQHILCVKPLVLKYEQSVEIEKEARKKGLFIGVEYHKRFDRQSFMARKLYREGRFGELMIGHACLMEPWYYRHSNFQNWFTCENTDPFTYIGCHYVDLVAFITGLKPVEVSVDGKVGKFPNGKEGYLYSDGRVIWENGAILDVVNGLGYPNAGAGGNMQGMQLFFEGAEDGGYLEHQDQFRGVKHSYIRAGSDPGDSLYNEPNPHYMRLLYRGGDHLVPAGYGYESIEAIVNGAIRTNDAAEGLKGDKATAKRREAIEAVDAEGIIATPANSSYNELVMEAGRLSIRNDGRKTVIEYGGKAGVRLK
ncbi:MAG: Gfo/Idh/MocA family oxidoreductase [Planctomycetes bacterium]|nr:Gfo/Idh/MocA family oxidoreductase [Planctomycetota bacterium]